MVEQERAQEIPAYYGWGGMAAQGLGLDKIFLSEALHSHQERIFVDLGSATSPLWAIIADRTERRDAHPFYKQSKEKAGRLRILR